MARVLAADQNLHWLYNVRSFYFCLFIIIFWNFKNLILTWKFPSSWIRVQGIPPWRKHQIGTSPVFYHYILLYLDKKHLVSSRFIFSSIHPSIHFFYISISTRKHFHSPLFVFVQKDLDPGIIYDILNRPVAEMVPCIPLHD